MTGDKMLKQLKITVAGGAGTGQTTIMALIEQALIDAGIDDVVIFSDNTLNINLDGLESLVAQKLSVIIEEKQTPRKSC